MAKDFSVTSRLPVEWHGLFKELQSSKNTRTHWFTEETFSVYGSKPSWHRLFSSLLKCDPVIEEQNLAFKPRFLLLQDELQSELMKFFLEQAYIIPDTDIKQFVLAVTSYIDTHYSIHQQLVQLFKQTKFSEDLLKDAIRKPSSVSQDAVQDKQDSPESDVLMHGTQHPVIILDDSDSSSETMEPANKRPRIEPDISHDNSEAKPVAMETEELNNDDDARLKEDSSVTALVMSEGVVHRLKQIWQNCSAESDLEGLKEVSKLSVKEIEMFCKVMDFDSMSDDSIKLVCQHLCEIADSLSLNSAVCILTFVLGHRVMNLSQKPSRELSEAVTIVTHKFPKQTVDGILLPCFLKEEISVEQGKFLCKMIKENLNPSDKGYFLQTICQKKVAFSESKIPVLQASIDSDCEITSVVLSSFVTALNNVAVSMAKNLNFGKLLLAIVNRHSKLFDTELKNKFEIIADKHATLLKKRIQAALNKIKV